MARLFTTGFELNTLTDGVELFRGASQSGAIVTSPTHGATYAYQNKPSASVQNLVFQFTGSGTKTVYYRWYYYVVSQPASNTLVNVFLGSATGTICCRLRGTGSGLRFTDSGDTQRGSDFAVSTNTWHRIEAKIFSDASAGTADILLDGASVISVTGINTNGSDLEFFQVGSGASVTHEYYVDDIAFNDGTTGTQNTYPGVGSVVSQRPAGAGDSTQWARGGTDSGANWSQTNEVTPNDATNYVSANSTLHSDLYTVTASGIGANATVNVVHVGIRFNNAAGDVTTAVKAQLKSSGVVSQSAAFTASNTTWRTNGTSSTQFNPYPLTLYLDPAGGTWTQALVDAMQIGMNISATGTNAIQVTTVWTTIDYTAAVGLSAIGGAASQGGGIAAAAIGCSG